MERDLSETLRESLLGPGEVRTDTAEFVGRDETRTFAVGLVRAFGGGAVAYASDGERIGAWLTGSDEDGRIALSGREGSRLEAKVGRGVVEGQAEIAGQTLSFTLEPATKGAGVYRLALTGGERALETGWIATNDGAILGIAEAGGEVVLSFHAETDREGAEDDPGEDDGGIASGPGGADIEPRIFHTLRCGFHFLKYHRQKTLCLAGNNPACTGAMNAESAYNDLGCEGEFGPVPAPR